MKIRYYQSLTGFKWIGFTLAILAVIILSNAEPNTQKYGWMIACASSSMWTYFAWNDKDLPRTIMEFIYLALAIRAVINWI